MENIVPFPSEKMLDSLIMEMFPDDIHATFKKLEKHMEHCIVTYLNKMVEMKQQDNYNVDFRKSVVSVIDRYLDHKSYILFKQSVPWIHIDIDHKDEKNNLVALYSKEEKNKDCVSEVYMDRNKEEAINLLIDLYISAYCPAEENVVSILNKGI